MGCSSNKPGKNSQPVNRQANSNQQQTQNQPNNSQRSPAKNRSTSIKEIKEEELKKHNEVDILQYIKLGKLDMVHGLIKYYKLGLRVMSLSGHNDDFMFNDEKLNTSSWNPLLLAIAYKHPDIVRYLLDEIHVSLINLGRVPFSNKYFSDEQYSDETFSVKLAIANKDTQMLAELWNQLQAWDYPHLQHIVQFLIHVKWTEGLQTILRHKTSEIIFLSQTEYVKADMVKKWMELRNGQPNEIVQCLDTELTSKPYSLISIYVLLDESSNSAPFDKQEILKFLQKAQTNITANQYGYLKFSSKASFLKEGIESFSKQGSDEAAAMEKLNEHFQKLDQELQSHPYFQSDEKFQELQEHVLETFQRGDSNEIKTLIEQVDLRRLFHFDGLNYQSKSSQIQKQENLWSPVHRMIFQCPQEDRTVDMLQELAAQGFHLKSALRFVLSQDETFPSQDPMAFGAALELAIEKKKYKLFEQLISKDFIEVWTRNNQYYIREALVNLDSRHLCHTFLSSDVAMNIFISMSMEDQTEFIQVWTDTMKQEVNQAFSQSPYSSMVLLRMIDKINFIKMNDFSLFQKCLDVISQTELEALSKMPENDGKFLTFLRYVNMLDDKDERKLNGQKLIDKIYQLPSYKAYQNQSLAILDNESQIQEEEDVHEGIQIIHVNQVDLQDKNGDHDKKKVRFNGELN